jgi:hypothetical protein
MAIDLARGISAADRAFRAGCEKYGLAGNQACFQFTGAPVGLVREVTSGRIKAGIDVFPEEPVPADAPVRSAGDGVLLSAHRTGGMPEALRLIGRMTVADAELILRGLSPQLCRRADPALASRLRSKPVGVT